MKIKFLLSGCLLLFATVAFSQTGQVVPELKAFDQAMSGLLAAYDIPGGQMAVTYRGRLVYNRGFGFANTLTRDSVQPTHIFRIADVSKTVTGIACMKLYEEGKLDLDARVFGSGGILNDAGYQNIIDPRVNDITVRMLLHHEGGWNSEVSDDPMFSAWAVASAMGVPSPPPADMIIQYMLSQRNLDFDPGTQAHYSNFGYAVLGRVIEKVTGKDYDDYVAEAILTPLGITKMKTGFNLSLNHLPGEVSYYDYPGAPLGYSVYDNVSRVPRPYGGFNIEAMDATAGWVASAHDLMKLICAIDGFDSRPDILTKATIEEMAAPSAVEPAFGHGIYVNDFNNWWHSGSLPGSASTFFRNGSGQLNWAILLNSCDRNKLVVPAMEELVWNTLPSITKWPDIDLFDQYPAGIGENTTNQGIELFPNPASTILNIAVDSKLRNETALEIFNPMGRLVFARRYPKESGLISVDISQFPEGIYLVRTTSGNNQVSVRIIVVKR